MSKFSNFKSYDGSKVQKRGYRKNEVWEEHKSFILDLVRQGEKQRNILEILKTEKGFTTNLNQLKSKLGIWGASNRNLAKKQRKWIYLVNKRRKGEGKETVFYYTDSGQEISESQLGSIMKGGDAAFAGESAASPGDLEMTTPPPSGPDVTEDQDIVENSQELEAQVESQLPPAESETVTPVLEQDQYITSPSTSPHAPSTISSESTQSGSPALPSLTSNEPGVSDLPILSPSIDRFVLASPPPASPETSVSFDDIYKKVLQKLDSFHLLATNPPQELRPEAGTEIVVSTSAVPNPEHIPTNQFVLDKENWPGPNSNEFTEDLEEWMEEEFNDALMHCETVVEMMRATELPFSVCRDEIVADWINEYEEDPLPYHICCAIVEGRPVIPVVNESEGLPDGISFLEQDIPLDVPFQRNSWTPIVRHFILTVEEWERIDKIHTKYYAAMLKKCTRISKSYKHDPAVVEFRRSGAHLQLLRHGFSEFSYFTVVALGAFASTLYHLSIDDDEAIFVIECAVKAYQAIGLAWHERARDVYIPFAHLNQTKGDLPIALKYYQHAYAVGAFRYGPESLHCTAFIADIAKLNFQLGRLEEGDAVLKIGLKHIQNAAAKGPLYAHGNAGSYIIVLQDIATLYKRVKGDKIALVVAKWAAQEFHSFSKVINDVENLGGLAGTITGAGRVHSMIGDYGSAVKMHQWAFDINSTYYGEKDDRTVQSIRSLCRAMNKRGLVMYVVPILEKTWRICQDTEDETELKGPAFEVWMDYSKAVLKLSGHGEELKKLKKRLAY
ncbi:hypothetical protein TWF132_004781 [Orbilia oligospora]|nr:hypothetical protein TWF751_007199 [Orbilia oligospora]KAF3293468.1 hypothetical protein TWF132_004781 [Orbilia oligospora]